MKPRFALAFALTLGSGLAGSGACIPSAPHDGEDPVDASTYDVANRIPPDVATAIDDAASVGDGRPDLTDGGVVEDAARDASDADAALDAPGARAWEPADLGDRLVLWLDAREGVVRADGGNRVIQWRDRSAARHLAGCAVPSRGVEVACPTLTTEPLERRPTEREPGIAFDGVATALDVPDSVAMRPGVDDLLILIVVRNTSPPGEWGRMVYGRYQATYPFTGPAMFFSRGGDARNVSVQIDGDRHLTTPSDGYNDGVSRLFGLQRVGSRVALRVNRRQVRVDDSLAQGITFDPPGDVRLFIGGDARGTGASQWFRGIIHELIMVRRALVPTELDEVERYLVEKHAL